jgi:hypothetical protein
MELKFGKLLSKNLRVRSHRDECVLTVGTGRGLHANEHFEEGELIMRIPLNCLPNLDSLSDLREQYFE